MGRGAFIAGKRDNGQRHLEEYRAVERGQGRLDMARTIFQRSWNSKDVEDGVGLGGDRVGVGLQYTCTC